MRIGLAALVVMLCASAPVRAATIGTFSWNDDPVFGPLFTVENFGGSGIDFGDASISATLDDASTLSFDLGTILAGDIRQTFEDLSSFSIVFATLTLNPIFSASPAGIVTVAPLAFIGDSKPIDFAPSAVPEPSTLLLVTGGVVMTIVRYRRRSRRLVRATFR